MELGVNLAVEPFSIGLTESGQNLAGLSLSRVAYDFSENIMAHVDELCQSAGRSYYDIEAIGVVSGP